jgi:hypothetical protein
VKHFLVLRSHVGLSKTFYHVQFLGIFWPFPTRIKISFFQEVKRNYYYLTLEGASGVLCQPSFTNFVNFEIGMVNRT